ncbi:hypothetical protein HanXRQr2_Chr10g0436511 [Helianthus annuus]|uniref:Uncharacterized protein n=1 Tax=Helianthus annuus TaxID=4232 RepID=A0A9K3N3Y7_HELAN|nr:hypothetical protein HanXRQr2_Chr10g0436511 [Helianthus annuus]KAJ0883435.1 hypothetical protein HanPSC8_Chr10g0421521 [Helianthus annuus]
MGMLLRKERVVSGALSPIHGSNPQVMRPESRDLLLQQVQEKTERIGLLLKLGLLLVRCVTWADASCCARQVQ